MAPKLQTSESGGSVGSTIIGLDLNVSFEMVTDMSNAQPMSEEMKKIVDGQRSSIQQDNTRVVLPPPIDKKLENDRLIPLNN